MSEIRQPLSPEQSEPARELCACLPLSPRLSMNSLDMDTSRDYVPVAPALGLTLRAALTGFIASKTPCSLLLLHITQFEHISMPPTSPLMSQRLSCHAPATFLEQVLQKVCNTLRVHDQVLAEESGTGAAILFPGVDQEGILRITQRVAHSISLLHAETVIPPLRYETEIALGRGSYPRPADSLEALLDHVSQIQEKITYRPAVVVVPTHKVEPLNHATENPNHVEIHKTPAQEARAKGIPFMQIPSHLPTRLKRIVPHALALELRCAPVGRNHNRLTVAMADPTDTHAVSHLREATGMLIFPVSCEPAALETLLASGW